jgi:hypothetical protein
VQRLLCFSLFADLPQVANGALRPHSPLTVDFESERRIMQRQAGIWIDHREALIAFPETKDDTETTQHVLSGVEKRARYSGHSAEDGSAEDRRDHQYMTHLDKYYDDVIAKLKDAAEILIFGPGEAKVEFNKRLAKKGFAGKVVGVETVDKMTEPQIRAKVRQHFAH